jgi:hypothetical protein
MDTTLVPDTRAQREGTTAEQLRAVYAVMRILAEDDRERAGDDPRDIHCQSCRRERPSAGSVDYAGTLLCNGCATDYELLRIAGQVPDLFTYLHRR